MRFETISLLLNWLELRALFAILSRLARTFNLIASTQRELRRAIHHLGEHRVADFDITGVSGSSGIALVAHSPRLRAEPEMR